MRPSRSASETSRTCCRMIRPAIKSARAGTARKAVPASLQIATKRSIWGGVADGIAIRISSILCLADYSPQHLDRAQHRHAQHSQPSLPWIVVDTTDHPIAGLRFLGFANDHLGGMSRTHQE